MCVAGHSDSSWFLMWWIIYLRIKNNTEEGMLSRCGVHIIESKIDSLVVWLIYSLNFVYQILLGHLIFERRMVTDLLDKFVFSHYWKFVSGGCPVLLKFSKCSHLHMMSLKTSIYQKKTQIMLHLFPYCFTLWCCHGPNRFFGSLYEISWNYLNVTVGSY